MSTQLTEPPITKYLSSKTSKTIDLVNLCRRIIADWPYHDRREFANFVEISTIPPGVKDPKTLFLLTKRLVERTLDPVRFDGFDSARIPYYLRDLSMTMVLGKRQPSPLVTAKTFKEHGRSLSPEGLIDLFWRLRMRSMSIPICPVIRQMLVEEFKRRKYKGFLLPNGKVVPLDSMHLIHFTFTPKDLAVMDFHHDLMQPLIEDFLRFDTKDGFICFHIALAFHLPEKDDEGNLGKVMIIDPTCAQFGMKGDRGELVYFGYLEDYLKKFPAKKISVTGFINGEIGGLDYFFYGVPLKDTALANLKSESCEYCGEVERKENPEIKLIKCSRCKKVSVCDGRCMKMAWESHRFQCKRKM